MLNNLNFKTGPSSKHYAIGNYWVVERRSSEMDNIWLVGLF